MLVICKAHGDNTHMTQSFSPERNHIDTMLRELSDPLHALDPTEYRARCHTSVTNDEYEDETNWNLLRFTYWRRDESELLDDYEEMMGHLIDASADVTTLLADYWDVTEDDMPSQDGTERHIAKYDGRVNDVNYELTVIDWLQQGPHMDHSVPVLLAVMKSHEIDEPAVHLLYVDGIVVDARKIPQQSAFDDFSFFLDDLLEPHMPEEDYAEFKQDLNLQLCEVVGTDSSEMELLIEEFGDFLYSYPDLDKRAHNILVRNLRQALDFLLEQEEKVSNSKDHLTSDDTMHLEQLLKVIPLHEIDTNP